MKEKLYIPMVSMRLTYAALASDDSVLRHDRRSSSEENESNLHLEMFVVCSD